MTACFTSGSARARLEQLWSTEATRGLSVITPKQVAVLAGKAFFLPPKTWKRLYLPFKVQMEGGTSVAVALQKEGIIAGLSITKGGQLRINAYNTTDAVVYLTPKTAMVHVWADKCGNSGSLAGGCHGRWLAQVQVGTNEPVSARTNPVALGGLPVEYQ